MTRLIRSILRYEWSSVVVVILVLAVAILLGSLIATSTFRVRELIIMIMVAAITALVLMPTPQMIRFGFILWLFTFGLGWRSIYLTPTLNVHPAEILIWLLFGLLILRSPLQRLALSFSIPIFIPILMLFAVVGLLTAFSLQRSWEITIQESKVFFVLVPIYYVVQWMIRTRADWERAIQLTVWVATYIALLGVMDLVAPGLSRTLAGNPDIQTLYASSSQENFGRIGFIFFGNFSAGFVIFTFLGVSLHNLFRDMGGDRRRIGLDIIVIAVQVFAIYLSGYRGLYYAVVVFLLVYAVLQSRAWFLIGSLFAALPLLPSSSFERFSSLWDSRYADSSQFKRFERASQGFDLANQQPIFGWGWGGSGYVHSDLLQWAANLGYPAAATFVLWICALSWQMWQLRRSSKWIRAYASALLSTMLGLLVVFAGEGLFNYIQLVIPIWFLLAMAYKLIQLAAQEQGASPSKVAVEPNPVSP